MIVDISNDEVVWSEFDQKNCEKSQIEIKTQIYKSNY